MIRNFFCVGKSDLSEALDLAQNSPPSLLSGSSFCGRARNPGYLSGGFAQLFRGLPTRCHISKRATAARHNWYLPTSTSLLVLLLVELHQQTCISFILCSC